MKKLINSARSKFQNLCIRANNFVQDVKGDLATNTIGAIIVAVVIIGLLVVAKENNLRILEDWRKSKPL